MVEVLKEVGLEGHDIVIIRISYWTHTGCIGRENGNTYINAER